MGCYGSSIFASRPRKAPTRSVSDNSLDEVGPSSCTPRAATPQKYSDLNAPPSPQPQPPNAELGGERTRDELSRLAIRDLKQLIEAAGGNPSIYLEKAELVDAAWRYSVADSSKKAGPAKQPTEPSTQGREGCHLEGIDASVEAERVATSVLDADAGEAEEAVRSHCQEAVKNAATRLERTWELLNAEVDTLEAPERALIAAVQSRNVFDLIDMSLEMKHAGTPISRRFQHLAFEASVAEEAWLVRRSILEAVEQGSADDIELWAEQARLAGDDVSVEVAFSAMLRWADEDNPEGDDEEDACERPPEMTFATCSEGKPRNDSNRQPQDKYSPEVPSDEGMMPLRSSSLGLTSAGSETADIPEHIDATTSDRASAPYSASSEVLRAYGREEIGGRHNKLRQQGTPVVENPVAQDSSAPREGTSISSSAYNMSGKQLPREEAARAPRYADFWGGGKSTNNATEQSSQDQQTFDSFPSSTHSYANGAGVGTRLDPRSGAPRYADFWTNAPSPPPYTKPPSPPPPQPTTTPVSPPQSQQPSPDKKQEFANSSKPQPSAEQYPSSKPSSQPRVDQHDKGIFGSTAPARETAELSVTFQPGKIGMSADWDRGKVTQVVDGSQAHRAGVKPGMKILKINGYGYSKVLLDLCVGGRDAYQMTFLKAKAGASPKRTVSGKQPSRSSSWFDDAEVTATEVPGGPIRNGPYRRVKLIDFLQAKSNEPDFAKYHAGASKHQQARPAPQPPPPPPAPKDTKRTPEPPPRPPANPPPPQRSPQSKDWTRWTGWWGQSNSADASEKEAPRQKEKDTARQKQTDADDANSKKRSRWTFDRFRESRDNAKSNWQKAKQEHDEEQRQKNEERERDFWDEQFKKKQRDEERRKGSRDRQTSAGKNNASGSSSYKQSSAGAQQSRPAKPARPTSREAYLELLGFGPEAEPTAEDLKKAYRKMAMQWHPDRPHNRERAAEATEMFQAAKEAYDYFMEEHKRL